MWRNRAILSNVENYFSLPNDHSTQEMLSWLVNVYTRRGVMCYDRRPAIYYYFYSPGRERLNFEVTLVLM